MDKELQDELNVDPHTPPTPEEAARAVPGKAIGVTSGPPKVARCPTCQGPLLAAYTRESSVSVCVCEKCRRRWDHRALAERGAL